MKDRKSRRASAAFHPNYQPLPQKQQGPSAAKGNSAAIAALERRLENQANGAGQKGAGRAPTPDAVGPGPTQVTAKGMGHPLGTDVEWHQRECARGRRHLLEQAEVVARLTKLSLGSLMAIFERAAQIKDTATALRTEQAKPSNQVGFDSTDEAHLGVSGHSQAHSFDWDSNSSEVSPKYPEGWEDEMDSRPTVRNVFNEYFDTFLEREFGSGVTREIVGTALAACEWASATEATQILQAGLFRAEQEAAILSLDVEASSRYEGRNGATFCNIYAHDLVQALGGYLPRVWWNEAALKEISAGKEVVSAEESARRRQEDPGQGENTLVAIYRDTVREMNANDLCQWLREYGADFGWRYTTDMNAAQDAANSGKVVVLSAAVAERRGHITVIAAETDEHKADRDEQTKEVHNPLESQAGYNSRYGTAAAGDQWWKDDEHTDGAAYILENPRRSNLLTPEEVPGLI